VSTNSIAEVPARRRSNELFQGESRERLLQLIENVKDYAIFMLDPAGHVASWNFGAERLKGYTAEIIGQHFSCFYPAASIWRTITVLCLASLLFPRSLSPRRASWSPDRNTLPALPLFRLLRARCIPSLVPWLTFCLENSEFFRSKGLKLFNL
jgi:hypothetical protein